MSTKDKTKETSIANATFVILLVAIASKLASFIVEAVLAAFLGASAIGDAYYMISGIQQVLYPMLSVGIWKVFLPQYEKTLSLEGTDQADALANKALFAFTAASILFSALLAIFSGPITALVAPGFDDQTSSLCAKLVCITSPMYIFIIVSSVYATMLQCHNQFFASQVREIATHAPLIIAALLFFDLFGVWALAGGLLVGALVRLLVEIPFIKWGYRFRLDFHINTPEMRSMAGQMPSALLASGADQITILVNKIIASMQVAGTVSILNYASKLQNVFIGLFSSAVLTASYPRIAKYVGNNDELALSTLLEKIICTMAIFLLPISIASFVLGEDLVVVLFQRGAFDADASAATSIAFICYAAGLLFSALFALFNNVFYAFGKAKSSMVSSFISMGSNVVLCILLANFFGAAGLALSASLSYLIASCWQIFKTRKLVHLNWREILVEVVKSVVSSCAAILPLIAFLPLIDSSLIRLLAGSVSFAAIYFLLIFLFKTRSSKLLLGLAKRRLKVR